ncbi:PKD domain-containing protein [Thalassotalea ganghwensis]
MAFPSNAADITPPEFKNLELSTNTIDVTDGNQELDVTLTVMEAESEIKIARVRIYPGTNVNSPHSKDLAFESGWVASGEENTYTNTAKVIFDQGDPTATWNVTIFYIIDTNQNTGSDLSAYELNRLGFNPYITVTNPKFTDLTPPEFRSIALSTNYIDLSNGSKQLTVDLTLFDAESSIKSAIVAIMPPTEMEPHQKFVDFDTDWVAGDEANTYTASGKVTFDSEDVDGKWRVVIYNMTDTSGNTDYFGVTTQEIEESGTDPYINITNTADVDTTPPAFKNLALSTHSLDVSNGSKQLAITVTLSEAESTISEAWMEILPPEGVPASHTKRIYITDGWEAGEEENTYTATANVTFDDSDIEGTWTIHVGRLIDNNQNADYSTITAKGLQKLGITPHISVRSKADSTPFDSKVEYDFEKSSFSTTQNTVLNLTIEDGVEYEFNIYTNDLTELSKVNFFHTASYDIDCHNAKHEINCSITATPYTDFISIEILSATASTNDFSLMTFLAPKGLVLESDWSSNRLGSSDFDYDGDGIGNNADTDDDNDGVLDVDDAFPLDSTESVDTDADGIGNNADTDDDNDGVLDTDDAFPLDSTESVDTDADGIGNNADTDDDNDGVLDTDDAFPLDSTESVDTDADGIGNNADTDDDGDGIPDEDDEAPLEPTVGDSQAPVFPELTDLTFEATGTTTDIMLVAPAVTDNNLNAPTVVSNYQGPLTLGLHEITWTATDFVGNIATAIQRVKVIDTTPPSFPDLQVQTIDAKGIYTDIASNITLVANDLVDGDVEVQLLGDTVYTSGSYTVAISAEDFSGNYVESAVEVHIQPQVVLNQQRKVEPGAELAIPVYLSGNAAVYPVDIIYEVTGVNASTNYLKSTIEEGIKGSLHITIPADAVDGETVKISLLAATNAVLSQSIDSELTVDTFNYAPSVAVTVKQNQLPINVIDTTAGVVTVTANIYDSNSGDTHTVNWSTGDTPLSDLANDDKANTFEFSPELLSSGNYSLVVNVTEGNTSETYATSLELNLVVKSSLATLSDTNDSDNDGISDLEEGYTDSDQDGISDYLDASNNPSLLPIDGKMSFMRTINGLSLSLGDIARTSRGETAKTATIEIVDIVTDDSSTNAKDIHFTQLSNITNFNITGLLTVGDVVPVVIPLTEGKSIPEGAVYRKYSQEHGWFDFVIDDNNALLSASKDNAGNCPPPLSDVYQLGLNVGDNCIELLIKDGGSNDADGQLNGMVKDPGVLAVEIPNQAPVIDLDSPSEVNENTNVTIDASGTTDAEGDNLSFQWEQLSGPSINLSDTMSSKLTFMAPEVTSAQEIELKLTVSDGRDSVSITTSLTVKNVEAPPVEKSSGGGSMGWLLLLSLFAMQNKRKLKLAA